MRPTRNRERFAPSPSGSTPAQTYLDVAKILDVAARSGADAVHPGYGFLAENADFAQAVLDAGLVWIGPPPAAITALGDKVQARHIAQKVGAPLVPGTADPVSDADEVVAFAREFGLPVAIKAAFGGGGRGLKVARTLEDEALSIGRDGASDAISFLEAGIPAVEFGPVGGGHHGPDEWVSLASLQRYRQALTDFVRTLPEWLAGDRPGGTGLQAIEGGLA